MNTFADEVINLLYYSLSFHDFRNNGLGAI